MRPTIKKVGAAPGTLTYTGEDTTPTEIKFFKFEDQSLKFESFGNIEDIQENLSKKNINWIDVTGFENISMLEDIGRRFNIDQLTMEDLLNVSQLPKIEEHDSYLYITLKLIDIVEEEHAIEFTHYSMIITKNLLITFSEKPNKLLNYIEDRFKVNNSKFVNASIEYLSYRIIDTIVDYYYYSLEWLTNVLSELEIELVEHPSKKHINTILTFKKQWLILRKAFYPFREAVRRIVNLEQQYLKSAGIHYINDLNDHLQSIGETMEIIRETLDNLIDLYNSTVSNRMNEVMQVLTIVSTIFIPLTFIAGIYGMNFQNMPELAWENGYYYTLIVMLIIGISMAIYMKRKRWF